MCREPSSVSTTKCSPWNASLAVQQESCNLVSKGKLHSKIISYDLIEVFFRRIRWWRSEVEIRTGRRSNKQRKQWHVRTFVTSWCHLAFMQGHASDSKCSWSAGISWYATLAPQETYYVRLKSRPFRSFELLTPGTSDAILAASLSSEICWPFFSRLFGRVPVRIFTPSLHHRTLRKKKSLHDLRLWFSRAVFLLAPVS